MFAIRAPIRYDGRMSEAPAIECKHGLKHGCAYCHVTRPAASPPAPAKKRTRASALSEKMNDRMTALKRRLRQIRGE
jgi:hypothetical protein